MSNRHLERRPQFRSEGGTPVARAVRMLPRLALVLGLASSTLGSGCAQNLMQCTPSMPGGDCASSDDTEGKEVAAAIVGGVLLIAVIKMATEIVPLVMYIRARGHAG